MLSLFDTLSVSSKLEICGIELKAALSAFEQFEEGGTFAFLHGSKLFISFQTLRVKIHERQSSFNTMFFPNSKITGDRYKSCFNCKLELFSFLRRELVGKHREQTLAVLI